jgi:hypothetical protein
MFLFVEAVQRGPLAEALDSVLALGIAEFHCASHYSQL